MTHTHSIAKMLEIKDKNIILEEKITEKEINDVNHGVLTYTPQGCINCGIINQSHADIVKNGNKTSRIKLGQFNFKPVYLDLKKQRFMCKHCETTFIAETNLVDRH